MLAKKKYMNMNECTPPKDVDWSEIEIYRLEFEYLKHLTTICTGSILLVIAFLEKLFSKPEWKCAVAIALVCFLGSIILSSVAQALIIEKVSERKSISHRKSIQNWTIALLIFALISYVAGIICLAAFGLKNLL